MLKARNTLVKCELFSGFTWKKSCSLTAAVGRRRRCRGNAASWRHQARAGYVVDKRKQADLKTVKEEM